MLRMLLVSCMCISIVTSFCALRTSHAQSQSDDAQTAELQRKTQNPVSDLISLPFQNTTNFDFGPDNKEQNILIPTATNNILGQDKWCAGPTGVLLAMRVPMVFGALANNVWSFASAGNTDKPQVNQMLLQPFFNYNLRKGLYLTSAPIITANWEAAVGRFLRLASRR